MFQMLNARTKILKYFSLQIQILFLEITLFPSQSLSLLPLFSANAALKWDYLISIILLSISLFLSSQLLFLLLSL